MRKKLLYSRNINGQTFLVTDAKIRYYDENDPVSAGIAHSLVIVPDSWLADVAAFNADQEQILDDPCEKLLEVTGFYPRLNPPPGGYYCQVYFHPTFIPNIWTVNGHFGYDV